MNCQKPLQSRCLSGVARCDITPPVGIYHRMWGAARHDRSTGIHRPLTATVLFLRSHSADAILEQVVIAIDHCLLWTAESNRLLDFVSSQSDVARDTLTIFFSHTHAAGLMGLERRHLPGGELIEPYLMELGQKIASLVVEARNRLSSATIVYGQGHCQLAAHRDYFDTQAGHYVCGFNPDGPADDSVVVGRVTNDDGKIIATIVNYACHPTTLAWDNTLISPDYVGAMREVVEQATEAPCVFIQGASGDIGPREGFVGNVDVADRNGRQLGYAVLATLESIPSANQEFAYIGPVISGATIGTWKYRAMPELDMVRTSLWKSEVVNIPLKYRSDLPDRSELDQEKAKWQAEERDAIARNDIEEARNARARVERTDRRMTRVEFLPEGDSYPYSIPIWRIGDAIWVSLDGEHYNVLQRTLRERFRETSLIIGTIANGSKVWYLLDSASYGKGLYQEEVSVLTQGALEAVIDAVTAAIQRLLVDG